MKNTKPSTRSLARASISEAPLVSGAIEKEFKRVKKVNKRTKLVPYVPNASIIAPKVGETISVCHRTTKDDRGLARIERSSVEVRKIKQVYLSDSLGFTVKDNVGDVWTVRPSAIGGTKWETYTRNDKQRVAA